MITQENNAELGDNGQRNWEIATEIEQYSDRGPQEKEWRLKEAQEVKKGNKRLKYNMR